MFLLSYRRPYYLTEVPGLLLNAGSGAQVDKAVLVQYVFSALSLILKKHIVIWQETEVKGQV